MEAVLMICLGVAIGGAAVYLVTPKSPDEKIEKRQVSIGDVTDLIDRLRPFTRDPTSEWGGVRVTITGVSARVEFRTKESLDFGGGGPTLKDAVAVLQDSAKLKDALAGWGERPPR